MKPLKHKKKNINMKKLEEAEERSNINENRKKIGELDPDEISSFSSLPLCSATQKGLKESGFTEPTKVQKQTLVHSLQGLDVVGEAKTGSGKTLAFVIPILELLYAKLWNELDGLGAVIITPTRELAYQIYEVFSKVGEHHNLFVGLVIGGKDLKYEWKRIRMCNIIICTPGRFLQHMTENPDFSCDNVQILVLDEADRCLSMGFEDTMSTILEELPRDRQTLLFSATQTRDVKSLIRAGCKNPVFCSVHEYSKTGTPKTLKESYLVCEESDKIKFLWSFLKHHKKFKILVFLSTCKQAKFIYDLFTHLRPGLTVMTLHGDMHQLRRMAVYDEFCQKEYAVLFATDVAARGLDIPSVDWVIQLDCPEDNTTYIHRAGRTARHTKSGEALLVLTPPQEDAMVKSLKVKNIPIEKISVDPSKLQSIQLKMEFILSKYTYLKEESERAFKSYIKNLWFMKNKNVSDIASIDLDSLARSLGLTVTPRIRFHERKLKKLTESNTKAIEDKPENKTYNLGITQDEDSEDDFLVKSKSQPIEDSGNPEDILKDYSLFMDSAKESFSKYDLAKKVLKRKLEVNNKLIFDEHGNPVSGSGEPTDGITEGHRTGIDLSERQEFLKAQDKHDKVHNSQRVKEKHRMEKAKLKALIKQKREGREKYKDDIVEDGEEEEEEEIDSDIDEFTSQIIDELPDPDRLYRRSDDEADSDTEEKLDSVLDEKLKRKHRKKDKRNKRNEAEDSSSEYSSSSEELEKSYSTSPQTHTKEEKQKKEKSKHNFSGKRKAKEEARAKKRAKIAAENDFESISCTEKESLALYLLQGS